MGEVSEASTEWEEGEKVSWQHVSEVLSPVFL